MRQILRFIWRGLVISSAIVCLALFALTLAAWIGHKRYTAKVTIGQTYYGTKLVTTEEGLFLWWRQRRDDVPQRELVVQPWRWVISYDLKHRSTGFMPFTITHPGDRPWIGPGIYWMRGTDTYVYYWDLMLPYWIVALLLGPWPAVFAVRILRRRRYGAGLCRACGYDLRASKDRCPECGAAINPQRGDLSQPAGNAPGF